jgi:hypothetical protein
MRKCPGCETEYETYIKHNGMPYREFCSMACSNRSRAERAANTLWEKRHEVGDLRAPRNVNKISIEEDLAIKNSPKPLCACGCGQPVKRIDRKYIFGHYANVTRTTRITKRCLWCQKEIVVAEKYKDRHNYCSKTCEMKHRMTGTKRTGWVKRICPICQSEYETTAGDLESGRRVTCSYACGIEASRRSRIISPDGYPTAREPQRDQTLQSRQKCDNCEYGEITDLLVIHHIDHNPRNGNPANILLLCPMCHAKEHHRLKTGWFTETKHGYKKDIGYTDNIEIRQENGTVNIDEI